MPSSFHFVQGKQVLCSLLGFFRRVFIPLFSFHPRTGLRKSLSLPQEGPQQLSPLLTRNNAVQLCFKEGILLALLPFYFLDFLWLWISWLSLCWGHSSRDRKNNGHWQKLTMPPVSGEESVYTKQNAVL